MANLPKKKKNLLRSFEGFDLLVSFTKCCGAHELLDSDLSGSVVENVTEREGRELIAPLTAAKLRSVCHPVLSVCVSACHAPYMWR